ncbi:acyltransferase family protein [Marinomonas sp. TI.3.20]|uniref:acyltransferase family protein n=1 Tax=Marinomonas sp. TI.3.20 TaxID=3121296 RepID=UPI00311E7CB6
MNVKTGYYLRALLVLMVFVQHVIFIASADSYSDPAILISTIARGDYAVGMLFSLSGYVIYKTWSSTDNLDVVELGRRLIRLIVPMFVSFLLVYLLHAFGAGAYEITLSSLGFKGGLIEPVGMRLDVSFWYVIESFFSILFNLNNNNLVLVAWVLPFEILFSVVFFCMLKIYQRLPKAQTASLLAMLLFIVAMDVYFGALKGLPAAFSIGAVIAILEKNKGLKLFSPVWVGIAMAAFLQSQKIATYGDLWLPQLINSGYSRYVFSVTEGHYFFYSLMMPLYAFLCSLLISKKPAGGMFRWMYWIGERSYSFHLMGQVSIMIVAVAFNFYMMDGSSLLAGNDVAFFLVSFCLLLVLVQVFYYGVEKKTHITRAQMLTLCQKVLGLLPFSKVELVSAKNSDSKNQGQRVVLHGGELNE